MSDDLDPLKRALFYAASFEAGILPIVVGQRPGPVLATLSHDEARKMKRKFRKTWKKSVAQKAKRFWGGRGSHFYKQQAARYVHRPDNKLVDRTNHGARRALVYHIMLENVTKIIDRAMPTSGVQRHDNE